jgi:GntR family transcriptional regulator
MSVRARQRELAEAFFARVGTLDRESRVPLYYQLQELIKQDIEAGHWQPGEVLPSEGLLIDRLGISRTVIRKALDVLEADGQVVRRKGRGTMIERPKVPYHALGGPDDWHDDRGNAELSKIVGIRLVSAGTNLARILRVGVDARLFEITTVASARNQPISLSQAYVRVDASPALAAAAESGAALDLTIGGPDLLTQLVQHYQLPASRSDMTVEGTTANDFERELLNLPARAPMFLIATLVAAASGQALAFVRAVVRSDHFRLTASLFHQDSRESSPVAARLGQWDSGPRAGQPDDLAIGVDAL